MAGRPHLVSLLTSAALVAAVAASVGAQARATPEARTSLAEERQWVVLVDDLHLDFVRTGSTRRTVTAVVRPLFEAGLLAGMRTNGPSSLALTTDDATPWSDVADAIKRISGNGLKASDVVQMLGERRGPVEVVYRAQLASEVFDRLVRDIGAHPAVVLLISNGYRSDIPAVSAHLTEVAAIAGRARLPVVVLDPGAASAGPRPGVTLLEIQHHQQASAASLRFLASDTGGTVWEKDDTLASVEARLARTAP